MGDRKALEQSRQVLAAVRRLRPAGHTDIIDALIAYADTSAAFGEQERAFNAYNEVRCTLQKTAPDSSLIGEVANKMLALKYAKGYNVKSLKLLMGLAVNEREKDWSYYCVVRNYATRIMDKVADKSLPASSPEVAETVDALKECAREVRDAYSQQTMLSTLSDCSKLLSNAGEFALAESFVETISLFIKDKKRVISNRAKVTALDIVAYSHYKQRAEDAFYLLNEVVEECIKNKTGFDTATTAFWLMSCVCAADPKRTVVGYFARFVQKDKDFNNLVAWARVIENDCLTVDSTVPDRKRAVDTTIIRLVDAFVREERGSRYGITEKSFYRMRNAQRFYYEALWRGVEEIYGKYSKNKITVIKKEEKKG